MPADKEAQIATYINDSLRIIKRCLQLIEEGELQFYRVIAVQLRMLLCDSTRQHGKVVNISLLPRLLPEIKLHAMDKQGHVTSDQPDLPLNEWLAQPLTVHSLKTLTIRELVRRICDQDGGAHYDPKPNTRLDDTENNKKWMTQLGSYLVHQSNLQFNIE